MVLRTLIRKETKSRWEGRAPLTPKAVGETIAQGIPIFVESSLRRVYRDEEYHQAGAIIVHDRQDGQLILGIKEPRVEAVGPGEVHVAFSHTIKGQPRNMPLLQRFLDTGSTLIDYEAIRDRHGSRVIAFGRFAGIAGAVDTLHVAGKKLALAGKASLLASIRETHHYRTIENLKRALESLAGLDKGSLKILIVGTGNVGKGCREVCRWLGFREVNASALLSENPPPGPWFSVLKTEDIVVSKRGSAYDFHEYRELGTEAYDSSFARYLGAFDILLQTPYWDEKYPRQLTREQLATYRDHLPMVIGDISCDIEGSLASTLKSTTITEPAYTYLIDEHRAQDGISWAGPTVMSVDYLPCELPRDASEHFSSILKDLVPIMARMDLDQPLAGCGLTPALQAATIVYRGQLTPRYQYLAKALKVA